MEITHSKGTLYPALQLSSFRVRKHPFPSRYKEKWHALWLRRPLRASSRDTWGDLPSIR